MTGLLAGNIATKVGKYKNAMADMASRHQAHFGYVFGKRGMAMPAISEILEIYEIVIDSSIMVLSAFVARLFWRTYQEFGNIRNAFLALVFFALMILKGVEILFIMILGFKGYEWVHSPYVFNFIWLVMLVTIMTSFSRRH